MNDGEDNSSRLCLRIIEPECCMRLGWRQRWNRYSWSQCNASLILFYRVLQRLAIPHRREKKKKKKIIKQQSGVSG